MKRIILSIFIVIILFVINLFFGNPISKFIVNNSEDKYIKENYGNLNLERDKIFYNFKDGYYNIRLQDENSVDTTFLLSYDSSGRLKSDNFDDRLFNTFLRFENEIRNYGKFLEKENNFNYEISLSILDDGNNLDLLKLDEKVDFKNFPLKVSAGVLGFSNNLTFEEAMKILQELQKILDKENFEIRKYSIILIPMKDRAENGEAKTWENALSISDIPSEIIINGDINELRNLHNIQNTTTKE
ncbi:DUF3139 domain-containing protein [Peptoniphilus sp. MSJ-1]|uniref:DUF3139 domain-containing protein n=1 Tax=Peptoniphilus ovalis TaxID=2841503 RepID=A0ABS6FIM4_9FIRM|nr:DUF3139 domain-containing protein [Peptoniphilus ovalis]MBU5670026.1 DUF3139 domain-containing protein [Peptoniphilus ovalis]